MSWVHCRNQVTHWRNSLACVYGPESWAMSSLSIHMDKSKAKFFETLRIFPTTKTCATWFALKTTDIFCTFATRAISYVPSNFHFLQPVASTVKCSSHLGAPSRQLQARQTRLSIGSEFTCCHISLTRRTKVWEWSCLYFSFFVLLSFCFALFLDLHRSRSECREVFAVQQVRFTSTVVSRACRFAASQSLFRSFYSLYFLFNDSKAD